MGEQLTVPEALIATALSALVIFALRLFPFALFSQKDPPPFLRFVERSIPPLMIAILLVYSLRDLQLAAAPHGAPALCSLLAVVLLHVKFHNSMVSIGVGTVLYMVLCRLLG